MTFVVRTAGNLLRSRPSDALVITTLLVVLVGFVAPFLSLAGTRGFAPVPPAYFAFLDAIVMYLLLVEALKRRPAGRMLR